LVEKQASPRRGYRGEGTVGVVEFVKGGRKRGATDQRK